MLSVSWTVDCWFFCGSTRKSFYSYLTLQRWLHCELDYTTTNERIKHENTLNTWNFTCRCFAIESEKKKKNSTNFAKTINKRFFNYFICTTNEFWYNEYYFVDLFFLIFFQRMNTEDTVGFIFYKVTEMHLNIYNFLIRPL